MPRDDAERQRLAQLGRGDELGYDPTLKPERLTAKTAGAKNDAKRVLSFLTSDDREREMCCWREPSLSLLEERGEATGLAEYFREVRSHLVPLFAAAAH